MAVGRLGAGLRERRLGSRVAAERAGPWLVGVSPNPCPAPPGGRLPTVTSAAATPSSATGPLRSRSGACAPGQLESGRAGGDARRTHQRPTPPFRARAPRAQLCVCIYVCIYVFMYVCVWHKPPKTRPRSQVYQRQPLWRRWPLVGVVLPVGLRRHGRTDPRRTRRGAVQLPRLPGVHGGSGGASGAPAQLPGPVARRGTPKSASAAPF